MKKAIILVTFILTTFASKAQSVLELFNNTNKEIYASYVYWDEVNTSWTSKGWFKIEKHSPLTLDIGGYHGREIYIHGIQYGEKPSKNKMWGDEKRFCVEPTDVFEIRYSDKISCKTKRRFLSQWANTGVNRYTFNPIP